MKSASRHWLALRITSLPLIPLFFYFLLHLEYVTTRSRMEFIAWAGQPVTTAALVTFVICAFYHACLGMEEIILDYLPSPAQKAAALILNKLFFLGLGGVAVYAALALHLGKF